MSAIAFAGAAQFAALGLLAQGVPWVGIIVLTALLNARHLLYSASLAPWFAGRSRRERAAAAYILTDEAFALAAARLPGARSVMTAGPTSSRACSRSCPGSAPRSWACCSGSCCRSPRRWAWTWCSRPPWRAWRWRSWSTGGRPPRPSWASWSVSPWRSWLGPSVGIVAGGLAGPAVALLVRETPAEVAAAEAAHDRRGGPAVSVELVALAVLMARGDLPLACRAAAAARLRPAAAHRRRVPPAHRPGHPGVAGGGQRAGHHGRLGRPPSSTSARSCWPCSCASRSSPGGDPCCRASSVPCVARGVARSRRLAAALAAAA